MTNPFIEPIPEEFKCLLKEGYRGYIPEEFNGDYDAYQAWLIFEGIDRAKDNIKIQTLQRKFYRK